MNVHGERRRGRGRRAPCPGPAERLAQRAELLAGTNVHLVGGAGGGDGAVQGQAQEQGEGHLRQRA